MNKMPPKAPKRRKPCKMTECPSGRWANASWCHRHWRENEKRKREEKKAKKLSRKLSSKKHQESERKSLVRKLDAVFSKLVRSLGKCRRCGKSGDQVKLDCSHTIGRANLAVRWDVLNGESLCFRCHRIFWHGEPALAAEWLKTVRTPEELAELNRRANVARKWTTEEMKSLLADLTARLSSLK